MATKTQKLEKVSGNSKVNTKDKCKREEFEKRIYTKQQRMHVNDLQKLMKKLAACVILLIVFPGLCHKKNFINMWGTRRLDQLIESN